MQASSGVPRNRDFHQYCSGCAGWGVFIDAYKKMLRERGKAGAEESSACLRILHPYRFIRNRYQLRISSIVSSPQLLRKPIVEEAKTVIMPELRHVWQIDSHARAKPVLSDRVHTLLIHPSKARAERSNDTARSHSGQRQALRAPLDVGALFNRIFGDATHALLANSSSLTISGPLWKRAPVFGPGGGRAGEKGHHELKREREGSRPGVFAAALQMRLFAPRTRHDRRRAKRAARFPRFSPFGDREVRAHLFPSPPLLSPVVAATCNYEVRPKPGSHWVHHRLWLVPLHAPLLLDRSGDSRMNRRRGCPLDSLSARKLRELVALLLRYLLASAVVACCQHALFLAVRETALLNNPAADWERGTPRERRLAPAS